LQVRIKEIVIGLALGLVLFSSMRALADRRELDVFIGAREEYNDNIFFSYDNTVDDFITTLSGGLKFLNQTERTDLFLSAILERLLYSDESDLDATDQYYKGRFGYKFTPRLGAKIDAAYSMDSRPDRDVAESGLILSTVPRQIQNYGGAVDYDLTEITASNLYYRYTRQDFEPRQFAQDFPDYRAHRAGLGFVHRLDRYLANASGRLNFGYNRFTYPETDTETKVLIGTIGLAYDLTEKWRLLIDAGPDYYDSSFMLLGRNFTSTGWGGTGTLQIAYQGEFTGSSLTLFHGIEPASGRDGSAQRTSAILDIFYRFAERSRTGLSTGYYINKADSGELAILPLDEQTFNIRPWLRVDLIFDKLYLEASYTYTYVKDKTRLNDQNRGRNLVWLQLGLDWPILE
jgi:hypothetical protein